MWERRRWQKCPLLPQMSPPPPHRHTHIFYMYYKYLFYNSFFYYIYIFLLSPRRLSLITFTFVKGWSYMLGWTKFLKISFHYIEIFNILIISPQKWDSHPPKFWVGPIMFFKKKLSNWSSSYSKRIVSQVHFLL